MYDTFKTAAKNCLLAYMNGFKPKTFEVFSAEEKAAIAATKPLTEYDYAVCLRDVCDCLKADRDPKAVAKAAGVFIQITHPFTLTLNND